jgi:hypothetical protein
VFRLFGSKKELFKAACPVLPRDARDVPAAAEGKRGEEALEAMGVRTGAARPTGPAAGADAGLRACDDPDICAVVRHGFGDLVAYVERVSGCRPAESRASSPRDADQRAGLDGPVRSPEEWSQRLLAGCKADDVILFFGRSK